MNRRITKGDDKHVVYRIDDRGRWLLGAWDFYSTESRIAADGSSHHGAQQQLIRNKLVLLLI